MRESLRTCVYVTKSQSAPSSRVSALTIDIFSPARIWCTNANFFRYSAINILAVKAYGEAEFWLSGGKVILIFSLFFFTFITMVGGNPQGDAYGFRYWTGGLAFEALNEMGPLGKFEGFLSALWSAAFTVVGPEYISMVRSPLYKWQSTIASLDSY